MGVSGKKRSHRTMGQEASTGPRSMTGFGRVTTWYCFVNIQSIFFLLHIVQVMTYQNLHDVEAAWRVHAGVEEDVLVVGRLLGAIIVLHFWVVATTCVCHRCHARRLHLRFAVILCGILDFRSVLTVWRV